MAAWGCRRIANHYNFIPSGISGIPASSHVQGENSTVCICIKHIPLFAFFTGIHVALAKSYE